VVAVAEVADDVLEPGGSPAVRTLADVDRVVAVPSRGTRVATEEV
jgi:hypothetical protein